MSCNGHLKLTAEQVKVGLRRRHPAIADNGGPGAWTTVEEWDGIDLLALSAWSSAKPPIVGYEIKISRGDYRREILKPSKRVRAVTMCWAFYFAVPKGLLTKEEKDFVQPEHFEGEAFEREPCPAHCGSPSRERWEGYPHVSKWGRWEEVPAAYGTEACRLREYIFGPAEKGEVHDPSKSPLRAGGPRRTWVVCETCEGRGYMRKSVVEQEAPTLWIPPDVGLVEIEERSDGLVCRTVRKAPLDMPTAPLGDYGRLARWVSYRPDPRHDLERHRLGELQVPPKEV